MTNTVTKGPEIDSKGRLKIRYFSRSYYCTITISFPQYLIYLYRDSVVSIHDCPVRSLW